MALHLITDEALRLHLADREAQYEKSLHVMFLVGPSSYVSVGE